MPDLYAVIGNPISHSKSPLIHTEFALQTKQVMQYGALLAPLDNFASTAKSFQEQGGKGMNITVPFKLEAFDLSTQLTERAKRAQAVNTFKFDGELRLGDNTDGAGLVRDITFNLATSIAEKRILLMGAGGAARGVILPLLEHQPAILAIAKRTATKAQDLKQQFDNYGHVMAGCYEDFSSENFDLVINATSASLNDELPQLPPGIFNNNSLVYDMMYCNEPTRFLTYAKQQGVNHLADGVGMLVEQAAESFFLWRGIRPDTKNVIQLLKQKQSPYL